MANNRRMDGFTLKVYLSKEAEYGEKSSSANGRSRTLPIHKKPVPGKRFDGRSFKDVLLSNVEKNNLEVGIECAKSVSGLVKCRDRVVGCFDEPIPIVIKESEKDWLRNCLIVQISGMYDSDFVQQILRSEGFKVKVSCWSGLYAVIRFEEEEQIDIFWDLKDSLKPWISDIDFVVSFMASKKLKVWVCIEGLPLVAWSDDVFRSIGNRWGEFVRLDVDTAERNRFDIAKILISVNCLSAIPPICSVELNGKLFHLKLSKAEFEDERCWIGNQKSDRHFDYCSPSPCSSPRIPSMGKELSDDIKILENEELHLMSQKACAEAGLANGGVDAEDFNTCNEPTLDSTHVNLANFANGFGSSSRPSQIEDLPKCGVTDPGKGPNGNEELIDIPVAAASSSNISLGNSVSIEPVFDSLSGLYSIKPKLISKFDGKNLLLSKPYLSKIRNRGYGSNYSISPKKFGNKLGTTGCMRGLSFSPPVSDSKRTEAHSVAGRLGNYLEEELDEARASIEVCENSGLFFSGRREVVLEKLMELERNAARFEKRAAVKSILARTKAKIMFVQESKVQNVDVSLLNQLCGTHNNSKFLLSASNGSAGGLITIWDSTFFECESHVINPNFIVMYGKCLLNNLHFVLANVYGPNEVEKRRLFFCELKNCLDGFQAHVILGGDFNAIRTAEERIGISFLRGSMESFSDFIDELSLIDLPLQGGCFTWSNFRDKPSFSRLDRFLLSPFVLSVWPDLIQSLHPKSLSDHNPVSLSISKVCWGPRPFKWFDHLLEDKAYVDKVIEECGLARGSGISSLFKICKSISKNWVSRKIGFSSILIRELEKQCAELETKIVADSHDQSARAELKANRSRLWDYYRREEREWIQKSRIKWAEAGDRNTKFFHLFVSGRGRENHIGSLVDGASVLIHPEEIKKSIELHFKNIYNESNTINVERLDCGLNKLSEAEASGLVKPFTEEEIGAALATLESSKAHGPDGFNMGFLKQFWPCLKADILEFSCKFYKGEVEDWSFNHSFIVLIPKCQNPVNLEDYRPISLVGSVYKLLSKVLARRMGLVLGSIIGEQQFAFCPGKQILDCSLIANEVIDYSKRKGLKGVVFKVDFRKAYDTVDWNFLFAVMKIMGFGSVWCHWISMCISTAYISVLVNGSPSAPFAISRGLRQGCPLSPMLFNIVDEALSALLRNATARGLFTRLFIGQSRVEVSHIQFADDLILFCGADETQIKNVVRLLKGFELAAGLKLNLKKSKLLGINVEDQQIAQWASLLNCKSECFPSQYLGLPLGASRNSLQLWSPLIDKFKNKLAGWKAKLLSFAGRLTLVKSVLASLPVYFISLFPLPAAVNSTLTSLIIRFLWGALESKVIYWIRWETLCLPKSCGGLGLINFKVKNRALLNKWLWRFGTECDSLWRKVLCAKYEENKGEWCFVYMFAAPFPCSFLDSWVVL
ncbi:hypothetical protein GQ457_15G021490 [Hibiscus cannabinus]